MSTVLNGSEFLQQEKEKLLQHPLFDDEFLTTISSLDNFERERAKRFSLLYYPHILRTRLYQANTLGITPDENIQFVLSQILHDEYGEGDMNRSHCELYRKLMYALDAEESEINEQIIIPELHSYINTMMQLTQGDDWLAAVAAVGVASEYPIPKYYELLLRGLQKIPGVNEDDLELFIGHIGLDLEHAQMIENAIIPHLDNADNQQHFLNGLQVNMDARRSFHKGLYREVFA